MTEGDAILLRKYRPADACVLCGHGNPPARYSCTANRLPRLPESVGRKGAGMTYFL